MIFVIGLLVFLVSAAIVKQIDGMYSESSFLNFLSFIFSFAALVGLSLMASSLLILLYRFMP